MLPIMLKTMIRCGINKEGWKKSEQLRDVTKMLSLETGMTQNGRNVQSFGYKGEACKAEYISM